LSPNEALQLQDETRLLFSRAIDHIKEAKAPTDEIALDTLTAFLDAILSKKYTNPSSDVITILAGLDKVDVMFTEFVGALDRTIRSGRTLEVRQKAIEAALSMTSGAYQTGLLSYFTHRDLFPALMKYTSEADSDSRAFEPFLLLGLLANYNKFEFQNPYRLRLDDFVNETTIKRIVKSIGLTCETARGHYVEVQDDLPEGWSIISTLSYLGLRAPAAGSRPQTPTLSADATKARFTEL
jgi:hypothetical protein